MQDNKSPFKAVNLMMTAALCCALGLQSCGSGNTENSSQSAIIGSFYSDYKTTEYSDAAGFKQKIVTFYGPGPDESWFSDDDMINSYSALTYPDSNEVLCVNYFKPGVDDAWFTGDDAVSSYTADVHDTMGNVVLSVRYYGPGSDGAWQTDDDDVLFYATYSYGPDGSSKYESYFNGPGLDGTWFTPDDDSFSVNLT